VHQGVATEEQNMLLIKCKIPFNFFLFFVKFRKPHWVFMFFGRILSQISNLNIEEFEVLNIDFSIFFP